MCISFIAFSFLVGITIVSKEQKHESKLTFSTPSGFYENGFFLEIESDNPIYYTLDCTEPTENSSLYTKPIWIDDVSKNENRYSAKEDVSFEFKEDLLVELGITWKQGYIIPQNPVDKAVVVRAVSIDNSGNSCEAETAIYFVGYNEKTCYDGMGIISITTDPDELFDKDTGIYVVGTTFISKAITNYYFNSIHSHYDIWEANYNQHGKDWEVPAKVMIWDQDRKLLLDGKFGIRIQGKTSRAKPNKSLNIYARDEYASPPIEGGYYMMWKMVRIRA